MLAHLVFENDEFLCAASEHRNNFVACGFQGLDDGEHRGYTDTSSSAYYSAKLFNVSGLSERTYHVCDVIALVKLA